MATNRPTLYNTYKGEMGLSHGRPGRSQTNCQVPEAALPSVEEAPKPVGMCSFWCGPAFGDRLRQVKQHQDSARYDAHGTSEKSGPAPERLMVKKAGVGLAPWWDGERTPHGSRPARGLR